MRHRPVTCRHVHILVEQPSEKTEREIGQLELALADLLIATAESDIPVTDDDQGDDVPEVCSR